MAVSGSQLTRLGPTATPARALTFGVAASVVLSHTELWWGYAASSLGWLRCNNVIADPDVQQRSVPDEEATSMR